MYVCSEHPKRYFNANVEDTSDVCLRGDSFCLPSLTLRLRRWLHILFHHSIVSVSKPLKLKLRSMVGVVYIMGSTPVLPPLPSVNLNELWTFRRGKKFACTSQLMVFHKYACIFLTTATDFKNASMEPHICVFFVHDAPENATHHGDELSQRGTDQRPRRDGTGQYLCRFSCSIYKFVCRVGIRSQKRFFFW